MTDPKQWIDDGAPDPVRELLIAAREERPRDASVRRTLVALGAGGALSAGAESAAGAAARGGTSLAAAAKGAGGIGLAVKWGLVGAVAAVAVVGATSIAFRREAAPAPPDAPGAAPVTARTARTADHLAAAAAPPAPEASALGGHESAGGVEPSTASTLEAAPLPEIVRATGRIPASQVVIVPARTPAPAVLADSEKTPVEAPSGAASAEEASVMLEEVAMIDRARTAVARGDASAALAALDAYASRFKVHRFEPEALYLRMEALGRAGDREGQRRVAERLLAAFPSAPQSARARALLR